MSCSAHLHLVPIWLSMIFFHNAMPGVHLHSWNLVISLVIMAGMRIKLIIDIFPGTSTYEAYRSGCPCALKARKSPPAAQMPTPGSGLPPEGLWGRCIYFGDTWRPPTAPPPYEPRLWSRRRKAKCKGILRTSRKRRNRVEGGTGHQLPPKRAGATRPFSV